MYKHILVPVAFGDEHDNQSAFNVARRMASEGAKFTVMHVVEPIPSFAIAQIPESVFENSRNEMKKSLEKSAAELPGATPHLVVGHPGREIVEFASKNGVDCIVLASHRPNLSNYFLGSTADRVVRHAECSVHVVR